MCVCARARVREFHSVCDSVRVQSMGLNVCARVYVYVCVFLCVCGVCVCV